MLPGSSGSCFEFSSQGLGRTEHAKPTGQAENNPSLSHVAKNFLGHVRRKPLGAENLVRETVKTGSDFPCVSVPGAVSFQKHSGKLEMSSKLAGA